MEKKYQPSIMAEGTVSTQPRGLQDPAEEEGSEAQGQTGSLSLWLANGSSLAPHLSPEGPADLPRALSLSSRPGPERKGPSLSLLHTSAWVRAGGPSAWDLGAKQSMVPEGPGRGYLPQESQMKQSV